MNMSAVATEKSSVLLQQQIDRFLSRASLVLSSSLDYEETNHTITRLCVPALADWAMLDLLDHDGILRRVNVAHADARDAELAQQLTRFADPMNDLDRSIQSASLAQSDSAAQSGSAAQSEAVGAHGLGEEFEARFNSEEPFIVSELADSTQPQMAGSDEHNDVMRAVGCTSMMVVPLMARGERLGKLILMTSKPGRRYGNDDLQLLREFSPRAALALHNARLYQSAQEANAAKSKYVANMSHEIRSPMTAVLGYTDLLADREDDPEKLEFLNTIKRNGHFLLNIINDILDLSKIEAGKMEMVPEPFVLSELVSDVQSVMRVRAAEKQLKFSVEFEGPVPQILVSDSKRLRQILINLLGNAIKFTEVGAVRLKIRYRGDESPPRIRFDVIDSGIGMNRRQQAKLFEAFSQGDTSVTRTFGGSGLGLAISQRFAKMLGGQITVVSRPGKGSTVSCEVAAVEVQEDEKRSSQADRVSEQVPPANLTRRPLTCRVLVVDDRHDVRFLTQRLLQKSGASVELASDGIEAIEQIRGRQTDGRAFDLVMLDMQMPRLDGYQTAARLRSMGFQQPIIAMTADAMDGDSERCLENGCDDYLSKPIDAATLITMVQRHTRDQ